MQIPISTTNDSGGLISSTTQQLSDRPVNHLTRFLLKCFFACYYPYARFLTWLMPTVTLEGKRLRIPPTVYKPLENEQRFREFINPGDRICDLGCGCGVISVFVAEKARSVVALDIGSTAVAATRENCERLGINNVEVHQSDMFAATDQVFDCICANPPFVEIPMGGENTQWATSATVLNRLFREGRNHLASGGRIVVLYSGLKGSRLTSFADAEGFTLVQSKPAGPKSLALWLVCVLYMELFFGAHFFVFERR